MTQKQDDTRNTWTYFKRNPLHSFLFEYTMRKLSSEMLLLGMPLTKSILVSLQPRGLWERARSACSIFRRSTAVQEWVFSWLSVDKGIPWVKPIVKSIACLYGKNIAYQTSQCKYMGLDSFTGIQVFKLFQNIFLHYGHQIFWTLLRINKLHAFLRH